MGKRSSAAASRVSARPRRILVVDDDEPIRTVLVWKLRLADFEVEAARDGIDAMVRVGESLEESPPRPFDLVLSDVRMPKSDGVELLRLLRFGRNDLPFVLITGYVTAELCACARRLGAAAILCKPCQLDDVVATVCRVLGDVHAVQ